MNSQPQYLINFQPYELITLQTQQLISLQPYKLRNSTLQVYENTLQKTSCSTSSSNENNGDYSGNLPYFASFQTSLFVYFCVNYPHLVPFYLSSLVVSPLFFTPNYPLLATNMPLFKVHFAPFEPCFNGSKRFCLYHLQWIFMLFASHLAPFCTAFCTILHCVLHQNGLRLAPKCTAFSTKTPCV